MRGPRVFKYPKSPTTINIPLSDRSVLRSRTSCYTDTRKIYTAKNETSLFSQTPGLVCVIPNFTRSRSDWEQSEETDEKKENKDGCVAKETGTVSKRCFKSATVPVCPVDTVRRYRSRDLKRAVELGSWCTSLQSAVIANNGVERTRTAERRQLFLFCLGKGSGLLCFCQRS